MKHCREVVITKEAMQHVGRKVEQEIIRLMRNKGIPVLGLFHFKGIKHGVMRAVNDTEAGVRRIQWWPSISHAYEDGVDMRDEYTQYKAGDKIISVPKDQPIQSIQEAPATAAAPIATGD